MNRKDTMRVDATALRPTVTVADARKKALSFLESLQEPAAAPGTAELPT